MLTLFAVILGLSGCSSQGNNREAVDQLIEKAKLYTERKAELAGLEKQAKQSMAQLPLLQKKLEDNQAKLDNLNAELEALGSGEDQSYMQFQRTVKEANPGVIVMMSQRFLRDYPLSSRKEEMLATLETAKANQTQQQQKQAENEVQRKADMAAREKARLERFKAGKMTTQELKAFLGGKSQKEIMALMGPPSSTPRRGVWNYNKYYGISNTGIRGSVRIYFDAGRVNSVGLYSIRPN